jgi:hypothetical protein
LEHRLDEFMLASGGDEHGAPRSLACELLDGLGTQRARLVRLSVRRRGTHLTLAFNVPASARLAPADFHDILQQLAQITLRFATPAPKE